MKTRLITMALMMIPVIMIGQVAVAENSQRRQNNPEENKVAGQAKEEQGPADNLNSGEVKLKVAAILSKYKAANLTVADAKAINEAFRAAGVRRGPEQKAAIEAAGFDPQKISKLDPPPEKNKGADPNHSKQAE